jgi:hypothetical protein
MTWFSANLGGGADTRPNRLISEMKGACMNRLKMMWYQSGDQLLCRWVDENDKPETVLQPNTNPSHVDSAVAADANQPGSMIGKAA